MRVFKHCTAQARCRITDGGVIEATYSGPIDQPAVDDLRQSVLTYSIDAPALILRIDCAELRVASFAPWGREAYPNDPSPAAIVVRSDQFSAAAKHAEHLANLGIVRVIFMEMAQARRWADRRARPPHH